MSSGSVLDLVDGSSKSSSQLVTLAWVVSSVWGGTALAHCLSNIVYKIHNLLPPAFGIGEDTEIGDRMKSSLHLVHGDFDMMFFFCFSESFCLGGVGRTMPLTSVDCLLDTRESTDPVSEDAAAAVPLEFDADGGADEASWRMPGGGTEVEAAKTGEESCFRRPSMIVCGGGVDWSSSSFNYPGPDAGGSAEHLASGWLDAAGLFF